MTLKLMTDTDYIQKIIIDLVKGSPHFYTIIETERFRRFLRSIKDIFDDAPKNKEDLIEKLSNSTTLDELLMWSGLGKKTLTNIAGGERLSHNEKIDICKEVLNDLASFYEKPDIEKPDVMLKVGDQELSPEVSVFILVALSSAYSSVSGSIRSKYGKIIEPHYLAYLFESLNIHETGGIDSLDTYENGIYYLRGKKGVCKNGELSIVEGSGREIDALVFTKDPDSNKPIFILAIEFTVGGRGNPSAAVNKAKSLWTSFQNCLDNGLVFFAYDLGRLKRDIDDTVTQIYFKDNIGSSPLEIIYDLIESRLNALECNSVRLIDKNEAIENFEKRLEELE